MCISHTDHLVFVFCIRIRLGSTLPGGEEKGASVTTYYLIQILPGTGFANGINDGGDVVGAFVDAENGFTVPAWWKPTPLPGASPLHPPQYNINLCPVPASTPFLKVDNNGNAIGLPGSIIYNIHNGGEFKVPLTNMVDLNNSGLVVGQVESGGSGFFNFNTGVQGQFGPGGDGNPIGSGVNSGGDVVGTATDSMGNKTGFYFPGNVIDLPYQGLSLSDINDNKIAIGTSTVANSPVVYMNFQNFDINNPPDQQLVPFVFSQSGVSAGVTAIASAINNSNVLVGVANPGTPGSYAFVYEIGQTGLAPDISGLVLNRGGYSILDARDINDGGQIVGQALGPNGKFAYVASPILLFRLLPNLLPIIENILRGLTTEAKRADDPGLNDSQKSLLAELRKQAPQA
jgi:hypothetical protein